MINPRNRWPIVAGAALAGVLFLPAGIAVAAEPDIAACEQTRLNCLTHGHGNRVFNSADAELSGGAVGIRARSDCSTGTVTEADAPSADSGMAFWLVTLAASDADVLRGRRVRL